MSRPLVHNNLLHLRIQIVYKNNTSTQQLKRIPCRCSLNNSRTPMKSDRKAYCFDDLKRRVLELQIAPGTPLDEVALSVTYDLSRTPLREVLQRLAGEGYVTIAANRGATVSSMDLNTMRSFFQTAPLIYSAVARLAAENAVAKQISALKKVQSRFRKAVRQNATSDMSMLNHSFHEVIGTMAGNPYLLPSLNRLLVDHTRMSHRFYRPRQETGKQRVNLACDQHDAMIAAFEAGDAERSADLALQHWELSRSEIEKYVQPDPLPIDGHLDDLEKRTDAL